MADSFDKALIKLMRSELDALPVNVPAVPSYYSGRRSFSSAWAVTRPLALAVTAALLLGSVAAFASGSADPKVWVTDAARTLGIQSPDDQIGPGAAPSPHPSESPEPSDSPEPGEQRSAPAGSQKEPADKPTTEPVEHQTPEPESGGAEGGD